MYEMSQMSLYDTGVEAKYGDKLLTLSTCDSSQNNGRFVVVAKKINKGVALTQHLSDCRQSQV